jgi:hypothetical protein
MTKPSHLTPHAESWSMSSFYTSPSTLAATSTSTSATMTTCNAEPGIFQKILNYLAFMVRTVKEIQQGIFFSFEKQK